MHMEHSAGFIIFEDSVRPKFLLLHYEEGHWDFPKGHLEPEEEPLDAALRELREETSITDVQIVDAFNKTVYYTFTREGVRVRKKVDFFLAKTSQIAVKLSPEHVGYAWLSFDDAMDRLTYRTAKELLAKAYPFVRGK